MYGPLGGNAARRHHVEPELRELGVSIKTQGLKSHLKLCSDFQTNKVIWTIEAARCLAAGANEEAIKLLRMAATEVARVRRKNPSLRDILAAG